MQKEKDKCFVHILEHEENIDKINEKFGERIKKLEHKIVELKLENEELIDKNERLKNLFERVKKYFQIYENSETVHQFQGNGEDSQRSPNGQTETRIIATRARANTSEKFSHTRPGTSHQVREENTQNGSHKTGPQGSNPSSNKRKLHGRVPSKKLQCKCGEKFSCPSHLTKHLSTKFRGYIICDIENCNKKFEYPHLAEQHRKKDHRGHKPYACSGCKMFYDTKAARQHHKETDKCKTQAIRNQTFGSIRQPDPLPPAIVSQDADSSWD